MRNTSWLLIAAALVGACVADDSDRIDIDLHTTPLQQPDPDPTVAAREAFRLYQELAARLESRGYTTADALAAAEAGDEARVRELFGYTDTEYEAIGMRLQTVEHANAWLEPGPEDPDGLDCRWGEMLECAVQMAFGSVSLRPFGASWPTVAAVFVGTTGICAWNRCHWVKK
jgi:hypothetical protein